MPSKKQRRRRDKTFRHEYGLVTYDEEGNEVEVQASELREKKPEKPKPAPAAKKGAKRSSRPMREPIAPSWNRSLRRGGMWGAVMFVVVLFFFKNMTVPGRIIMGLLYAAAFIPLTYWIDRLTYRTWQRRSGNAPR